MMFMGLSRWIVFGDSMQAEKSLISRTAWGPFFERKTRKMCPHGGRLKRDFWARRPPQNGRLVRDFIPINDTKFQQNAEIVYHKIACKARPC
jgi:hypothetical protein